MKLIVFGYNGWIGSQLINFMKESESECEIIQGLSRTYDCKSLKKEITESKATHVLLATGKRNDKVVKDVDYLELPGKIDENIQNNIYGPATVAIVCSELNLHLTYISDGAIYNSISNKRKWTENDVPNGSNSNYYQCIKYTDQLLSQYSNCLVIRFSFPISKELNDEQNNYSKLLEYNLILNANISVTILPCFSKVIPYLIHNKMVGVFNLVNSGIISQLQLRNIAGKMSGCKVVSATELDAFVIAERPCPILSNDKISNALNIVIPDINTACTNMLQGISVTIDTPEEQSDDEQEEQSDNEQEQPDQTNEEEQSKEALEQSEQTKKVLEQSEQSDQTKEVLEQEQTNEEEQSDQTKEVLEQEQTNNEQEETNNEQKQTNEEEQPEQTKEEQLEHKPEHKLAKEKIEIKKKKKIVFKLRK